MAIHSAVDAIAARFDDATREKDERIAFLEARRDELQAANESLRQRATVVGGLNDQVIRLKMENDRLRSAINYGIAALGKGLA